MNEDGIVSIALGVFIVIGRGSLVLLPAATLRWFGRRIETESRTRMLGVVMLLLPAGLIWAGASRDSDLAAFLLIIGVFMLFVIPWLLFFPQSYMEFVAAFLPEEDSNSRLMWWRAIGLLGTAVGVIFITVGWRAL